MKRNRLVALLLAFAVTFSGCQNAETVKGTADSEVLSEKSVTAPKPSEENPVKDSSDLPYQGEPNKTEDIPPKQDNPAETDSSLSKPDIPAEQNTEKTKKEEETTQPNPDTSKDTSSVMQDSPSDSSVSKQEPEIYDYPAEEQKAEKLEAYLRSSLSPQDHGGIYFEKKDTVKLYVWVSLPEKLDAALSAYQGEPFSVERLQARCSLALLQSFAEQIDKIDRTETQRLIPVVSEEYNMLTANMSEQGSDIFQKEIKKIADELNIPQECFNFHIFSSENPLT